MSPTTRAKAAKAREAAYKLTHQCRGCGKPIVPGQTWKFTPEGGKVHYYCAKQNPNDLPTLVPPEVPDAPCPLHRLYGPNWASRPDVEVIKRDFAAKTYARSKALKAYRAYVEESNRRFYAEKAAREGNPAGPTFAQAATMARVAGAKAGDTDGFGPWLAKAGLGGRSPQVKAMLKQEFEMGVEKGPEPTRRPRPVGRPQVWETEEGWKTALDPDSVFDTQEDAQRFVEAQSQPRQNPSTPWWKRR